MFLTSSTLKTNHNFYVMLLDNLSRTDGCLAVLVTDRDGVPVVKGSSKNFLVSAILSVYILSA